MNPITYYLTISADGLTHYYTANYYVSHDTSNKQGVSINLLEPKGDKRNLPIDAPKSFLVPRDEDISNYDETMVLAQTEDGTYTLEPSAWEVPHLREEPC